MDGFIKLQRNGRLLESEYYKDLTQRKSMIDGWTGHYALNASITITPFTPKEPIENISTLEFIEREKNLISQRYSK